MKQLLKITVFSWLVMGLISYASAASETDNKKAPADHSQKAAPKTLSLREIILKNSTKEDIAMLEKEIQEAIGYGAPIYNLGLQPGMDAKSRLFFQSTCFKIYEGVAYKLLVKLGDSSPHVQKALKKALEKTQKTQDNNQNAWTMRRCFDSILGEPTTTGGQAEKNAPLRTTQI